MIHVSRRFAQWYSVLPVLACLGGAPVAASAAATWTANPAEDALVRATQPTRNYGAAGALAVAGPGAVNGAGQSQGRFDSLLKFDASEALAAFDSAFGTGAWTVSDVTLQVTEVGAPNNAMFNRGAGSFQVFWSDVDTWVEGTGTPQNPPVGTGDQATYNWLQSNVSPGVEVSLGTFAGQGSDGQRTCPLQLPAAFVADLFAGGAVSLHMAPVSDAIGFTFNSVNNTTAATRPILSITAVPEPATLFIVAVGCLNASVRSRRRLQAVR